MSRVSKAHGEDLPGHSKMSRKAYADQHGGSVVNSRDAKAAGFEVYKEKPGGRQRNDVSPVRKAIGKDDRAALKERYKRMKR